VNLNDVEEQEWGTDGDPYQQSYRVLTPSMQPKGGSLGVNVTRVPPGKVGAPFHYHMLEDEVFYVLSGAGVLRYGEELYAIRPGDCISCPAGTRVAHQIANTGSEDLVYLAIGRHDPNEVGAYPDSGKVMVRSLGGVGWLEKADYMAGEPNPRDFRARSISDGRLRVPNKRSRALLSVRRAPYASRAPVDGRRLRRLRFRTEARMTDRPRESLPATRHHRFRSHGHASRS
jgi:uncharacterized cupin superfamily protein